MIGVRFTSPTGMVSSPSIEIKLYTVDKDLLNQKNEYIAKSHAEMRRRGMTDEEIKRTISKTGFNNVMEKYPEE